MNNNTRLWDTLGKTDPDHTQKFTRGGGFKGTAIKPMWSYKRMTEVFGPCGIGWGVGEPSFQVVPGDNREVLVYCTVSVWYIDGEKHSQTVYGVGGDKIVTHIKANPQYNRPERWENDDEAFKKAFTDAVTNALKLIGVGADVHMGLFDDNKYVNTVREEFAEEARNAANTPEKSSAQLKREGAWENVTSALYAELNDVHTLVALERVKDAYRERVKQEGWNKTYAAQLAQIFEDKAEEIRRQLEKEAA